MELSRQTIDTIDSEGMWQKLTDFPLHWRKSMDFTADNEWTIDKSRIQNICFAGMGGSSTGADLIKEYVCNSCPVPVHIVRDYSIPAWVSEQTLFVACSFSGNTEETLNALNLAKQMGAQLVAVTSGGELLLDASKEGFDYIKIPRGFPYRAALGYSFVPLFRLFHFLGYTPEGEEALIETASLLEEQMQLFSNHEDNLALTIAHELVETLPVIYSGTGLLDPVNLRWRCQLQENAKMLAYGNTIPEMTHNEIVGWDQISHLTGRLSVIMLEDREDDPRVKARMDIVKDLIEDQTVYVSRVRSNGETRLARQFSLVQLGDWVSMYVALLNNVDPTPVVKIDLLKSRLAQHF